MSTEITRIVEINRGLPGKGVPKSGSEGQVLSKASSTDYDTEWRNLSASEIELEPITGIEGDNVQTAINALALNELRTVAPLKNTGSGNNTDTNTVSLDMSTVDNAPSLENTDIILIQRSGVIKSVTYDQLSQSGGDLYLKGTVTLASGGNSGTVVGDPLNASISEGVAPTVNGGDPIVGVQYLVDNTTVVNSISGESLSYSKGDYVEWLGSGWVRIIRTLDEYVESFNGRTNNITPQPGDYSADQVTNAADKSVANTFEDDIDVDGILTVIGDAIFNSIEGIKLPVGTTAERPVGAVKGYFRFNRDNNTPEYFDGTIWLSIDVEALEQATQQVADDLAVVEARVTVNETSIGNNASDITDLAISIGVNETDIATNVSDIVGLGIDIALVDGKTDVNNGLIVSLETRVDAVELEVGTFDARINSNDADILALGISIDNVDIDLQATKVRVSDNENDINQNSSDISLIDGRVTVNEADISQNISDIIILGDTKLSYIDSIVDLEALEGTEEGQVIKMTGYYAGVPLADMPDYIVDVNSVLTPNGGSVIARSEGGCFVWGAVYKVNVAWFGAKGDSVTDDTIAIQNAIDMAPTFSSTLARKSGFTVNLELGVFKIIETLILDNSNIHITSGFNATIAADLSTFTGDYLLETAKNTTSNYCKISNITFSTLTSNPFSANYDSGTFKSGASYTFRNSVGGIRTEDMHKSLIEDCKFVGLEIGLVQVGSWLLNVRSCIFEFNDRHIECFNNASGNQSNNLNKISDCVFGASVMAGGLFFSQMDTLIIENCDVENTHQTSIYLDNCRHVIIDELYTEENAKYYNDPSVPAYINSESTLVETVSDAVSAEFNGRIIGISAGQNYNIMKSNFLSSNLQSYVYAKFSRDDININNCEIRGTTIDAFFEIAPGSDSDQISFTITNVECSRWHKLTSDGYSTITQYMDSDSQNFFHPTEYWVDSATGSDDQNNVDISALTPLATLNGAFINIPKNLETTVVINILDNSSLGLNSLSSMNGSGEIKIVGTGILTSSLARLDFSPPIAGKISFHDITLGRLLTEFYDPEETFLDSPVTSGTIELDTVKIDQDSAAGVIILNPYTKLEVKDSEINNANAVGYSFIVRSFSECYLDNVTTNVFVELRTDGKIVTDYSCLLRTLPGETNAQILSSYSKGQGISANRPAFPVVGTTYFDITLGNAIWWNGGDWVDATGLVV